MFIVSVNSQPPCLIVKLSQLAGRTRTQQAEDGRPLQIAGRRRKLQLQIHVSFQLPAGRAAVCRRQEGEEGGGKEGGGREGGRREDEKRKEEGKEGR